MGLESPHQAQIGSVLSGRNSCPAQIQSRRSAPAAAKRVDLHPDALPLYQALEEKLRAFVPVGNRRVQKTQITFGSRHVFACVSFARVKRKAGLPEGYIVITLGLPAPLCSEHVAVKTEPYSGRWTHHIVVSRPGELDEELFSWVREAYDFVDAK